MADDIRRLYRQSPTGAAGDHDDRDTVRCASRDCGAEFVVEHVASDAAWTCPKCRWPHPNLHRHFVILGVVTLLASLGAFVLLVLFLYGAEREVTRTGFIAWSAMQIAAASYVVLATFGDRRAYGLALLRVLMPLVLASLGAFVALVAMALWFYALFIAAAGFLGLYGYVAWVFVHAFRMTRMHRPRETVVRPMHTLISVTVHVVLLVLVASIVVPQQRRTPGTSDVEFGTPGGYVAMEQPTELERTEEVPQIEEEMIEPDLEEIQTPEIEDINYESESDLTFIRVDEEERHRAQRHRRNVNEKYKLRYERDWALKWGGGSDKTEYAVLMALRWLEAHQNDDGSWGEPPYQVGMTGLALLCFLGHNEDHLSPEFGATVRQALEWLRSSQDDEGMLCRDFRYEYQHGIATYALAEAYAMTGLDPLRPVVNDAVEAIIHGQTEEGGWYYSYAKGNVTVQDYFTGQERYLQDWPGGDTSISGWQIQALTAAFYAGIRVENNALENTLSMATKDILSRVNASDGWSGYHNVTPDAPPGDGTEKDRTYGLTAIATLCLQFLGQGDNAAVKVMLNTMRGYRFDWDNTVGGWQKAPLYAWYYATQAKFHAAGKQPLQNPDWKAWNTQMTETLTKKQNTDGSWGYPGKSREGTDLVRGEKNKPVYATTLCCLMLEVYYRYLPTYTLH